MAVGSVLTMELVAGNNQSGLANGQYFNVPTTVSSGTAGSGLTVNLNVTGNNIDSFTIGARGAAYDNTSIVDVTGHDFSGNPLQFQVLTVATGLISGDLRSLFDREYVAAQPDNTTGPITWNLSDRDVSSGNIGGGAADKIPVIAGTGQLAEDVLAGQLLYLNGSGLLAKARANSISTSIVIGAALTAGAASENINYTRNNSIPIATSGANGVLDVPNNLVPGSTYYLSPDTAGNYTVTVPNGAGEVIVDVGTATSTATMAIEIQPPIQL